jgi:hypothetical protein
MTARRVLIAAIAASLLAAIPQAAHAQFLDKLKKKVTQARDAMTEASCALGCGTVRKSELFDGNAYESVAVTVLDGTGYFQNDGTLGLVRDVFESRVVKNGYMLAADADAEKARARMARGSAWTDQELAQLKEFVDNIDAVVVIDLRKLDMGRCTLNNQPNSGAQATVYLSARWLQVDGGDVPWVATHNASVCQASGTPDLMTKALQAAATQLTTSLPARRKTVAETP